ncbi:MAG: amino acid ABC transporter ATP-binding protein [Deltaproteobacteria bacterium]|jgi:ABC-type polar amino acid transport system ATPase subunit|nr:amino acid ABC transporter ATP-binding protein [Deltaproteobacteria bacterium]
MIKVTDLKKSFGDLEVLMGVNLTLSMGETVSIIGPSGSGKSTFIRCLNLLEKPNAGRIEIDDIVIEPPNFPAKIVQQVRLKVGMVFQSFNLFPHYTALENVAVGLMTVKGFSKSHARSLAAEYLEKVGLADKLSNYPAHLSGGQQQRVAIARTLAMSPTIILMDEPTSALDPELVHEVLSVIREVVTEHTVTSIIVTHELNFAKEISDRVFFMDKGVFVEAGPPSELFVRPTKDRTKAFLAKFLPNDDFTI